jgi:hypothetical protein
MPRHGPAQPAGQKDYQERSVPRHTLKGAPTDAAHHDIGDGALNRSVPADLTKVELRERTSGSDRDVPAGE